MRAQAQDCRQHLGVRRDLTQVKPDQSTCVLVGTAGAGERSARSLLSLDSGGHRRPAIDRREPFDIHVARRQHRLDDSDV